MFMYAIIMIFVLVIWPVSVYAQIIINEVELYPSVSYENQWVELFNRSNSIIDISGWTLIAMAKNITLTIPQGTIINPSSYFIVKNNETWMKHMDEVIVLKNNVGNVIDKVGPFTETEKDSATWQRYPNGEDNWRFVIKTPGKTNGGFANLTRLTSPFVEQFTISKLSLLDATGTNTTHIQVYKPLRISAEVTNNNFIKQPFTYIVKIENSDKITVHLSWFSGAAEEKGSLSLSQSWLPETPDTYKIEIFIWESLTNPSLLTFKIPTTTVIVEK